MIYADMVDRVSVSWRRLESIRMCWGYKYLAPTPQGAPRRTPEALNGISGLHPPCQIGRVVLRVHTILGECGLFHTAEGVDSMPRYGTSTPAMKAKADLPGHLPDPLSPRYTPQTP